MKSSQFKPGDKVVTLVSHDEIPPDTIGTITSRLVGTLYAVKLPNGEFHWLDSTEIASTHPNRKQLMVGDTAIVVSEKHRHPMLLKGDLVQVVKIIKDVDFYGVILEDKLHWLAGFELLYLNFLRLLLLLYCYDMPSVDKHCIYFLRVYLNRVYIKCIARGVFVVEGLMALTLKISRYILKIR